MDVGERVTGKMFDMDGRIIGIIEGLDRKDFDEWYKAKYGLLPSETMGHKSFSGRAFLVFAEGEILEICYENELTSHSSHLHGR